MGLERDLLVKDGRGPGGKEGGFHMEPLVDKVKKFKSLLLLSPRFSAVIKRFQCLG